MYFIDAIVILIPNLFRAVVHYTSLLNFSEVRVRANVQMNYGHANART